MFPREYCKINSIQDEQYSISSGHASSAEAQQNIWLSFSSKSTRRLKAVHRWCLGTNSPKKAISSPLAAPGSECTGPEPPPGSTQGTANCMRSDSNNRSGRFGHSDQKAGHSLQAE